MRNLIINTERVDLENPEIRRSLNKDLARMNKMEHENDATGKLATGDACKVIVSPSRLSYSPGFYQFRFEIEYGETNEGRFLPNGEKEVRCSESLPYIA